MTTKPLFSIITITKDDPDGFDKTKQSLETQTCRDFEWIVIDGNNEADSGIYNAMNKGLDRSQGGYILFLNGGDILADPETLTLITRHIDVFPSDFIYGDAMEHDGMHFHIKRARKHTTLWRGMFTHHQAMIYKRDCINGLRFDETYKIAGDFDFTARFLKKAKNFSYIPAPLCLFGRGGISQTQARLGRSEEMRSRLGNKLCGRITAVFVYARQVFTHFLVSMAR